MTHKNKRFLLGKSERFILKYLYNKDIKNIRYTTSRELLTEYNKENNSKVKSIEGTIKKLLNKQHIDREWVNNRYAYWISINGIIVYEKIVLSYKY